MDPSRDITRAFLGHKNIWNIVLRQDVDLKVRDITKLLGNSV